MNPKLIYLLTLLVVLAGVTNAKRSPPDPNSGSGGARSGISNSIHHDASLRSMLSSAKNNVNAVDCKKTYGFMPCSTTKLGSLFLIMVYGRLMYKAAFYMSNGSESLSQILRPGIVTAFFLPLLGPLSDAMLIIVSGLSGSTATAQDQVTVGMGLLAGSTVMRLTVVWGACVFAGKCDLEASIAIDQTDTNRFSLSGSGVTTYIWTSYAARIMAVSVLPFVVVQLSQALSASQPRHSGVLIALIISLLMLIVYGIYQVSQPRIQERRLEYVKNKRIMTGFLKHLKRHALGRLFRSDGSLNFDVVEKIFRAIDLNDDGFLSKAELRAFVIGMRLEGIGVDEDNIVRKVMKELDTELPDEKVNLDEFCRGISNLLAHARSKGNNNHNADTVKYLDKFDKEIKLEQLLLGDSKDEAVEETETHKESTIKAILFVVLGIIIAAAFADPLVDAVDNLSGATSIPSFVISFVALPLATSSGEAVSAIRSATKKTKKSASLTFSELYAVVTMKNILCMSVFLATVYVRGLTWNFSAEVWIIIFVCIIMGGFGSSRATFPLRAAFVAFLLYPLSLGLVCIFNYILHWS